VLRVNSDVLKKRLDAIDEEIDPKAGLVAYWKLDEGTGEFAADSSRNGFHGALKNGVRWVKGPDGVAVSFDGKGAIVESNTYLPKLAAPFSISLWVNPSTTQVEYATILGNHDDKPTGMAIEQKSKKPNCFSFGYGDGKKGYETGAFQLIADEWQHVAIVCDGVNAICYMNGIEKTRGIANGAMAPDPQQNFKLGQGYHTGRFFHGLLSNVRIYEKALSGAEIAVLAKRTSKK
jgi:hypothetical protein